MDQDRARKIIAEAARRAERKSRINWDLLMFDKQKLFVSDTSEKVAAVCSRRAGKSVGIAIKICQVAEKYGDCIIPYITLTKPQGKQILWPELRRLDKDLGLGLKFNQNELSVKFPNQATCYIVGGQEESELERLRGPKYPAVFIDEAQAFRPFLEDVITDIIEPALLDYNGILYLTGTPNAQSIGYFHDVTNTKRHGGWSVHHWTARDNPHIKGFEEWIAKRKAHYRWTDTSPTYLREWCGKWVKDSSALVYTFSPYNLCDELPEAYDWEYVLGIDLGYNDSTAFVVAAYSVALGRVYVLESYKETKLIPSAVAAHVERLMQQYEFSQIVADSGGLGKGYVEEMKQRYGLPIKSAEKSKKLAFIELLRGDLGAGVVNVIERENRALLEEASLLQWNDARTAPDDRYEDHLMDALLYTFRACKAFLHDYEKAAPKPGTQEWAREQEDIMEQAAISEMERSDRRSWLTGEDEEFEDFQLL